LLERSLVFERTVGTVQFSSVQFNPVRQYLGLVSQGQLLNEYSNARMHNYADIAPLLDKGGKSKSKVKYKN